jgi:SAM-dependent methyltransferase
MDRTFEQHRQTWDHLGESDPLWAILSSPDRRGNRWDLDAFFARGRKEIDGLFKSIHRHQLGIPRACALDFGCGVGRLTRSLAGRFDRVIGVDVAASMIQLARNLNSDLPNCEFVLNASDDLGCIESGSVDLVYSALVLQHIPPRYSVGYLREFVRVLSPQGLAVFQVIDQPGGSVAARLSRVIPPPILETYRHFRYGRRRIKLYQLPAERIQSALGAAGGQVVRRADIRDPVDRWKKIQYYVRRHEGGHSRG